MASVAYSMHLELLQHHLLHVAFGHATFIKHPLGILYGEKISSHVSSMVASRQFQNSKSWDSYDIFGCLNLLQEAEELEGCRPRHRSRCSRHLSKTGSPFEVADISGMAQCFSATHTMKKEPAQIAPS
eukprot:scaffold122289_cov51-Prasinocladus_malaysianus.AAC.1